ncbi:MAG TPA: hypothetical protein DIT25_02550 [Candidatus Moranbacteria bacterium]|nr:hypothetical protein [Candidatus Moranbacteria bacterium]
MGFLNKKIIGFDPDIFGIDLSDLSVKVLQLEKDGALEKIRSFSVGEIPKGNIDDGNIINKEKVAEIIKKTVEKAAPKKIKIKKVICSLPESKVFLRIVAIPKMRDSEVREAIKWEMEANIPLPIEQVYFDWQVLSSAEKNKQNVLTVAVSKKIVDDLMEVFDLADLEVYGLEVESVASARSLIDEKEEKKNMAELIVDLGAQRTSFIMAIDGFPYFTSSIPFSSESINDAIAKGLNLSAPEAEKVKILHGIESNHENPIFRAIGSLLENLVQEIEKTLDFYGGMEKEPAPVGKIILSGGGSNLKGLLPFLAKRLNKEVEIGDPWVNLKMGNYLPAIDRQSASRYSTVIGLALRGLRYNDEN